MRLATFYADCELPPAPREKQRGFDWHGAVETLTRSAVAALGARTILFTDGRSMVRQPAVRVGDARETGIMLWLLDAQAEAVRSAAGPLLMVSPDTLIAGPLDMLFGDWDVCLLTRARPAPIINSVIAVRAGAMLAAVWQDIADSARELPESSRAWGADVDAVVNYFDVKPREDGIRKVGCTTVRLLPIDGIFRSVDRGPARPLSEPIWDFKGSRKARLPEYARLLLREREAA